MTKSAGQVQRSEYDQNEKAMPPTSDLKRTNKDSSSSKTTAVIEDYWKPSNINRSSSRLQQSHVRNESMPLLIQETALNGTSGGGPLDDQSYQSNRDMFNSVIERPPAPKMRDGDMNRIQGISSSQMS